MENIYLHLPSNASPDTYPQNTSADFTTQLAKHVRLNGDWEAALVELQYVDSILNVRGGENYIRIRFEEGASSHTERVEIAPGYYASDSKLLEAINAAVKKVLPQLPSYLRLAEGGYVTAQKHSSAKQVAGKTLKARSIDFAPGILRQLGFESLALGLDESHTSRHPLDLAAGKPSQILVYCDKTAYAFVGHTLAPLLRAVPVTPAKFGNTVTHTFEKPLYFPLASKNFDSIEINLRDSVGRPIAFAYGTSCALLELRRRV